MEKKLYSRCLGCKLFIHFTYMRMYLHVYLICTQGPKKMLSEMLPVLCLSIILYIFLENGARARISPPSQTNETDWSHPRVFTVIHFRDQYMIGLPRLFAH